jgi:ParB/RepB/Spo0J family partition protein
MEKQGQLTPIVVADDGSRFIVIDGFKRQRAAEIIGLGTLMVVVVRGEQALMKAHMYLLNRKSGFSTVEEGMLIRELVEKDGLSQAEVAAILDRHKSWVSRRLEMIRMLSGQIVEDLKLGLIPPGSAKALARLPQSIQADFSAIIQTHMLQAKESNTLIDLWCKAKEPQSRDFLIKFPKKALELALGKDTEEECDPRVPAKAHGWFRAVRCLERVAALLRLKSKYEIGTVDDAVHTLLTKTLDKAENECWKALALARQAIGSSASGKEVSQ